MYNDKELPAIYKNSIAAAFFIKCKQLCIALLACIIAIVISFPVLSQTTKSVTGTVLDEKGNILSGVSVLIKGSKNGTSTDEAGKFTINVKPGDVLIFSMTSYSAVDINVNTQTNISVRMTPSLSSLGEVVVVGYGTQKKAALTSAVSSIKGSDIVTTKNENVLNSLAGKVPGLRIVQNSSEPGDFSNNFDIRGMGSPLLVVDGVPRTDITRIDPNDIESFSILKDGSAAIYGVRAANGVILITTKRGKKGTMELNYSGSYGWQVPIKFPQSVNAVDWMTLVNEKSMHNANGGIITYDSAAIAPYLNGTKQSTNWFDAVMRKSAPQTQHNISASGGSDRINYYASLGYTGQQGMFKSGDLNYKRYNIRSNVSAKITSNLTVDLNLNAIMDQKNQPYQAAWYIFRSLWFEPAIQPVYLNNDTNYPNVGQAGVMNPLIMSQADNSGYITFNNKWFQSSVAATYNIPRVPGLNIKGLYSYDYSTNDNKKFNKAFNTYTYNASTKTYTAVLNSSPSTIRREFYEFPKDLAQLSINYTHSFLGKNNVSALLLYETSKQQGDNLYAQRELSIPLDQLFAGNTTNQVGSMDGGSAKSYTYVYKSWVGRVAYDFRQKYFAQFSFREDASSKFRGAQKWGFFPEGELGWRISEENFWKNSSILSNVSNLKVRATYGETGDDNNANAYQFLQGYTYPSGGYVFGNDYISGVANKGIPNPGMSWYTAKTFDAGLDAEVLKGLVNFTIDYFVRNRSGIPSTQLNSLADVVGVALPQQNLNGDRTKGFDFEIGHKNRIGKLGYNVRATFGYSRTMNTTIIMAKAGNSYLNWKNNTANRWNDIFTGYGSNGQFQSYNEIEYSDIFIPRNIVVGDYRYEDWNGDGQIGVDDSHPIATKGMPLITYGVIIGVAYKGIDLNMVFQGAGKVNTSYTEQLTTPLWSGGSALSQFMDRWHPADPKADPYDPNTKWVPGYYAYTGSVPFNNTLSNLHSSAYCRLKSLEIGYTIPAEILQHVGIKNLRVFANGYNLLTFTRLKFLDPEHPSDISAIGTGSNYGYLYPLDRIYSVGLNVKF